MRQIRRRRRRKKGRGEGSGGGEGEAKQKGKEEESGARDERGGDLGGERRERGRRGR